MTRIANAQWAAKLSASGRCENRGAKYMTEILVMPDSTEDIKMTEYKNIEPGDYKRLQRKNSDLRELLWFGIALMMVLILCGLIPLLAQKAGLPW